MKYEVKRGSVVMFSTEHESCIDDQDKMMALSDAGHSLYIDGVRIAKKDIPVLFQQGAFSYSKFIKLKGGK